MLANLPDGSDERETRARLVESSGASKGFSEEEEESAAVTTRAVRVIVVVALLIAGIIVYSVSSNPLRANNSASPPTAFEVARDAEPQSRN